MFRRVADYDNPLQIDDLDAVSLSSDRIIVSALYCDRLGLPPSFPEVLAILGLLLLHVKRSADSV